MVMLNILGFMKSYVGKARLLLGVLVKITLKYVYACVCMYIYIYTIYHSVSLEEVLLFRVVCTHNI